jgi:superfamily II DNA/RNA helicase
LAEDLYAAGHKTAALHGDMTQGARNRTLTKLRHGDVKVLVATDVAARGIDVHGISHVINYDLPKFAEDYVHRIGRTGRANNTGIAISFASNMDRHILRKIEQFTGNRMEPAVIEGFEPKRAMRMNDTGTRGDIRRDGHKPGRGGFKPRDDRGSFSRDNNRGERSSFQPREDRPSFNRDSESRGNRDSAPRESFGNSARPEFNRSERPSGDRPRSFGDRNERGFGDRNSGGRSDRTGNDRPSGDRSSAPARRDSAPRSPRNEGGRSNAARAGGDRNFGNAGSSAPRRPRSFA